MKKEFKCAYKVPGFRFSVKMIDTFKPYKTIYLKNTALIESIGNLDKKNPISILHVNKKEGCNEAYFMLNFDEES